MRRFIWIIMMILIIPIVLNAHGNYMYGGGHMMGNWGGVHLFWWIVIPFILLFIILFIKAFTKSEKNNPAAFEILKIRYAKGEISKEELENMKKNLG